MTRLLFASATIVFLVACGPVGPMPGGRLSGPVHTGAVTRWDVPADEDQAQIETRPEDPHSVNTWFGVVDERLYVPTSMIRGPLAPGEREWVQNVLADPAVRIRLAGSIYDVQAVRVMEPREYASVRSALEKKYELTPEDLDPKREIWIFRMEPTATAPGR